VIAHATEDPKGRLELLEELDRSRRTRGVQRAPNHVTGDHDQVWLKPTDLLAQPAFVSAVVGDMQVGQVENRNGLGSLSD
jgi:hypothetical protein